MKIFINGESLSLDLIKNNIVDNICYTSDYKTNVIASLYAWNNNGNYSVGFTGDKFLNLSTSGTTGHPVQINHTRETIEQVVDSNIKILDLNKNSKIVSYYSPKGIAFTTLAVYICAKLGCELHIETFNGNTYVDRINYLKPTHTLLLPNIWKILHKHKKWEKLDLSSVDKLITGSDFTPNGMLDELRNHGPNKVYNVYGSTEVPPIVLYSEEENVYTKNSIAPGIELDIIDGQIACKWSSQNSMWLSGDCVQGDINRFTLNGRIKNMFKQDTVRVYPEQLEIDAVKLGADLALCQQINNKCVLYYTGNIDNKNILYQKFSYIPRFIIKQVDEIKTDDNLKKIIRTQTL